MGDEDCTSFCETVALVVDILRQCSGGTGIVISPVSALTAIQRQRVDFQVTDTSPKFPRGYMSELLKDVHVSDPLFREAMDAFPEHTDTDRWPEGAMRHNMKRSHV